METKTLIQAQANVLRVTALRKGDVIKMVEKEYSSVDIYYGVVVDLLNSGSDSFIQILRYKKNYGGYTAEIKTYSGEKDLALFPCEVNEVYDHFDGVVDSLKKDLKKKQKEVYEMEESISGIEEFINGEKAKKLTEASFSEITQAEYEEKKKAISQL